MSLRFDKMVLTNVCLFKKPRLCKLQNLVYNCMLSDNRNQLTDVNLQKYGEFFHKCISISFSYIVYK